MAAKLQSTFEENLIGRVVKTKDGQYRGMIVGQTQAQIFIVGVNPITYDNLSQFFDFVDMDQFFRTDLKKEISDAEVVKD
jgi:hypothetical protein